MPRPARTRRARPCPASAPIARSFPTGPSARTGRWPTGPPRRPPRPPRRATGGAERPPRAPRAAPAAPAQERRAAADRIPESRRRAVAPCPAGPARLPGPPRRARLLRRNSPSPRPTASPSPTRRAGRSECADFSCARHGADPPLRIRNECVRLPRARLSSKIPSQPSGASSSSSPRPTLPHWTPRPPRWRRRNRCQARARSPGGHSHAGNYAGPVPAVPAAAETASVPAPVAARATQPAAAKQDMAAEPVVAASMPAPAAPAAAAPPEPSVPAAAAAAAAPAEPSASEDPAPARAGAKKTAKGRRSSVPSWDEIMLGSSRQRD